jgi:hypothetical protein
MPPKPRPQLARQLERAPEQAGAEPAGLDYTTLGVENQQRMLLERLARIEQEHYNHQLNIQVAEAARGTIGDQAADAAVVAAKAAQVQLESAHATVKAQLDSLDK